MGAASLNGLDTEQVRKAAKALLTYSAKKSEESNNLLQDDELLYLNIALKKIPQKPRNDKPVRLPVPHALYSLEDAEACLFVKDHKGEGHKASKKKVKEESIPGISKVIGLSKLRTKYESHESKRKLCNSYDIFLADERVLASLPKLIGKSFFKKKKQPVPVRLIGKDWAGQVAKALGGTYFFWTGGSSLNIRIARASHSTDEVVENVVAALHAALPHLPKQWSGVKAVYMKTAESVALPVYQASPESDVQRIKVA